MQPAPHPPAARAQCAVAARNSPGSAACSSGTLSGAHDQPQAGGLARRVWAWPLPWHPWLSVPPFDSHWHVFPEAFSPWYHSCSKTWLCEVTCFSLEACLLFCFILDIYGPEQTEDHFPVQCHSGPVFIQPFQPDQKNSHQSVCPLISFIRLLLLHVRIRPCLLCPYLLQS